MGRVGVAAKVISSPPGLRSKTTHFPLSMLKTSASIASSTDIVATARYVTIELASIVIGLSVAAIRKRIERGVWLDGKEYRRGPDGRIWFDLRGFEAWVEQGP
jgi:hypothetical protein